MTRHSSWQLEMQPQMFVEMSEELAKEKGISNGEKVIVKSGRGEVKAVALVTSRFKPFSFPKTAAAATARTCLRRRSAMPIP